MFKKLVTAALVIAGLGLAGGAHACNIPNPNLLAPPFVDGCDLPAIALNNIFFHFSLTDTATGPMTVDFSPLWVRSQAAANSQTIYNQSVFSASATNFQGYDAIRGVAIAPALSTVNTITGIAGYTINNTVPIGQRSQTVAVFADAVCAANGTNCWGFDSIVSDNPTSGNTGVTAGTGKFLTNEMDLNITSPNSSGNGLAIGGTALPASIGGFNGVSIAKLWGAGGQGTGTALFANGFNVADAAAATGINIGASALSGASQPSMPVTLNYRAGNNTYQNITLTAAASGAGSAGTLTVGGSGSSDNLSLVVGGLFLAANNGLTVGSNLVLSADASANLILGNAAGATQFKGTGTWAANGSVATVLGSVGPVGSHTTVQEWFAVQNASGATRWIAGF